MVIIHNNWAFTRLSTRPDPINKFPGQNYGTIALKHSDWLFTLWPDKNRQMSLKVAKEWMILTPLQKLPNNVGDLVKIIAATGFELLPKVQNIAKSGHTGCSICFTQSEGLKSA